MIIWHNPRCSKSRQTLALLQENGHAPEIRKYLEDVPSRDEIVAVLALLNLGAADLVRWKEKDVAAQGISKTSSADALLDAMVAAPKLIERPIVITDDAAAIGRPPEAVLEIL